MKMTQAIEQQRVLLVQLTVDTVLATARCVDLLVNAEAPTDALEQHG